MEKVCEFCTALRPLVYCNADAAYLCLSCDAKVHLANALSGRHLRTLVCNSCGYRLAHVQCLDHKMLICRDCDQKLHDISSPHRKRAIRTFMGCPSAKDFATLWGFQLDEIEKSVNQDQFATISCVSADLNVVQASGKPGIRTRVRSMVSGAKFDRGSSSQQNQVCKMEIVLPLYYSDEIHNFRFQTLKITEVAHIRKYRSNIVSYKFTFRILWRCMYISKGVLII